MFLACRTSLVNCTCVIIKCIQSWVSAREFALLTADQYSEPAVTAKQFCIVRNTADWLFVARIINKWIKRRFQLLITRSISCFPIMFQLFVLLHNYIYWYCISSSTIEMYNFLVFPFYNIYIYVLFSVYYNYCFLRYFSLFSDYLLYLVIISVSLFYYNFFRIFVDIPLASFIIIYFYIFRQFLYYSVSSIRTHFSSNKWNFLLLLTFDPFHFILPFITLLFRAFNFSLKFSRDTVILLRFDIAAIYIQAMHLPYV